MDEQMNNNCIFISYSHNDRNEVFEFIELLKQDCFNLWYDEDIHNSMWSASIEHAIECASVVLLFVSPNSLNSHNVFNEISFADNAKKSIFCIYLSNTNTSDFPGWRLMLTKCQAFYAYKDGVNVTYQRLRECLYGIVEKPTLVQSSERPRFDNSKESKEEKQKKAKILCIQKRFKEAKELYDSFIADDILDMDGYMGYIRISTKNYKIFEGAEIDEAIQVAKDVCGEDDLSQFDSDYQKYCEKRKLYFANLQAEKRRLENERFNIGNIVCFGNYWQSAVRSAGKTPIEWIVLRREEQQALLISRYCLDCKPYSTDYTDATWERCNLRKWLNLKFISEAFSQQEQEKILLTSVVNEPNAEYETDGGNDTTDRIFLLSIDEAENLLNREERQAKCTDYAKAQGAWVDVALDSPYWWLRSPGGDLLLAAAVHYRGKVFGGGLNICVADTAVRPAMWISLE